MGRRTVDWTKTSQIDFLKAEPHWNSPRVLVLNPVVFRFLFTLLQVEMIYGTSIKKKLE